MDNKRECFIENGNLVYKINDAEFQFNLFRLFEAMNDDDRMAMAETIGWNNVFKYVIDRLCGKTDSWDGQDDELTLKILSEMEGKLISGYKWSWLRNLDKYCRKMAQNESLYWKLYHDKVEGEWFQNWAAANGVKRPGDGIDEIEPFKKMVSDLIEKALYGKKIKGEIEGGAE